MDHIYFIENKLYDLAKEFPQFGGTPLLLDEIHKHPNWFKEIKRNYDNFPKLHVIFISFSMLEIHKTEFDLRRRAIVYFLKELFFCEFSSFEPE